MKLTALISPKYLLFLIFASLFLAILPYVYIFIKLGYQAPEFPIAIYNDADYYYERMGEVRDGHPFLGNPYFIEHRSDLPPAFFLADWVSSAPLFLGFSMIATAAINFFLWSTIFTVLVYLLFRLLNITERWSFAGAIFVFTQLFVLMIRPVSMQVIFPVFMLFLIAFYLWLNDIQSRWKQNMLGLSAALTAYIYTYAWQIVIVSLFLTPIIFFIIKKSDFWKSIFRVFVIFTLSSLPLVLYTMKQVAQPFYWETMQRIGLVNTHMPTVATFFVSFWVILLFAFWWLLSRYDQRIRFIKEYGVQFTFFVLLGAAMVSVTCSNIITGKDLELPQHIERFIVLWLGLASVYTAYFLCKCGGEIEKKIPLPAFVGGTLFVALIFIGNVQYAQTFGVINIYNRNDDYVQYQKIQGFTAPLAWLREHTKEPAVVWVDPRAPLRGYIAMETRHYLLFVGGGALHIVSQDEVEERYLISRYFELTRADLVADYQSYGGVGNAYHGWKTHNRKVKLCKIFSLDNFGYKCGELTDRESFNGTAYFDSLYEKYEHEIRPQIVAKLKKYHVAYIIRDNETDRPEFRPELIPGTKLEYTDGRFFIYSFGAE